SGGCSFSSSQHPISIQVLHLKLESKPAELPPAHSRAFWRTYCRLLIANAPLKQISGGGNIGHVRIDAVWQPGWTGRT
ncbi:hypothetical protein, partial [Burkholderia ubonensis]|uniref:hypothetical protein n=1 Tax=Burkholderia ubonensis TaxID=101571 RepID=UPI001E48794C